MAHLDPVYTREDEYETQFYGFCQKDVMEHLKSSMFKEYSDCVVCLKASLLGCQKSDEDKAAVERIMNSMLEKWPEATRAPLERLQNQLHGFFDLPPHILLNEDKQQKNRYTPEDEINQKREIDNVNSRYRRAMYLKKYYEEELEKAKQLESRAELFKSALAQLKNAEKVANDIKSKELHTAVQTLLGAEVEEANLKLSEQPSCGESNVELLDRELEQYLS